MNNVTLTGRLTKDAEIRNISEGKTDVANFNLAIDRPLRQGQDKPDTDFPRCTVFLKAGGKIKNYLTKGRLVEVVGRIQTGSYEKNGQTVYTTDVVGNVNILEWDKNATQAPQATQPAPQQAEASKESFEELSEDVPF